MCSNNPADDAIAGLIKKLANDCTRVTINEDDKAKKINQIAALRQSMEPRIEVSQ